MLPADKIIPKQSRNIVKLKIVSNSLAQKTIRTQSAANALRDVVSASVPGFLLPNEKGNILSSLIAAITLGLLISKTFTYPNTLKKRNIDKTLSALIPNIFPAIIAAMFLLLFNSSKPITFT